MSDRHHAYTVLLSEDIKDEYSEKIIAAIKMIVGVESVEPHIVEVVDESARRRVKRELREQLRELLE